VGAYAAAVQADSPNWWWRCNEAGGQLGLAAGTGLASAMAPGFVGASTGGYTAGGYGYSGIAADSGSLFIGRLSSFSAELDNATIPPGFALEVWGCFPTRSNAYQDVTGGNGPALVGLFNRGVPWAVLSGFGHNLTVVANIGNGGTAYGVSTTKQLADGNFHHLVVVVGSGGCTVYGDGVSIGTGTGTAPTSATFDFQVYAPFNGTQGTPIVIAEVALYTGGLTATRVAAHYAAREITRRPQWRSSLSGICQ